MLYSFTPDTFRAYRQGPCSILNFNKIDHKLGHTFNPSTQEVEVCRFEFEARLGYMKPFYKIKKWTKEVILNNHIILVVWNWFHTYKD